MMSKTITDVKNMTPAEINDLIAEVKGVRDHQNVIIDDAKKQLAAAQWALVGYNDTLAKLIAQRIRLSRVERTVTTSVSENAGRETVIMYVIETRYDVVSNEITLRNDRGSVTYCCINNVLIHVPGTGGHQLLNAPCTITDKQWNDLKRGFVDETLWCDNS